MFRYADNDSESCHPSLHELAANGCLNELQARFSKISTGNTAIQSVVNESDRSGMVRVSLCWFQCRNTTLLTECQFATRIAAWHKAPILTF